MTFKNLSCDSSRFLSYLSDTSKILIQKSYELATKNVDVQTSNIYYYLDGDGNKKNFKAPAAST